MAITSVDRMRESFCLMMLKKEKESDIMKRKAVTVFIGGALILGVCGSSAQAMTYSYTAEGGKTGTVTYYLDEEESGMNGDFAGDGSATTKEDRDITRWYFEVGEDAEEGEGALTPEEEERLANWHKQEMRQQIAYLEKFGLSYDADRDVLMYQGRTVRWLIDRQMGANTYMAIQMPEGEIDVYTERAEDYEVTGLRVADQEEYDERTRKDQEAEAKMQEAADEEGVVYAGEDGSVIHTFTYDTVTAEDTGAGGEIYLAAGEDVLSELENESEETDLLTEEGAISVEYGGDSETAYGFSFSGADDTESKKKIEEYRKYGIDQSGTTGSWLWGGKEVRLLMDEDGSMYQNGSDEAVENKIYLLVKRDEDGSIREVKQVTVEEVMAERIASEEGKNN